jgi:tocopherol O-methyltransferase
MKEVTCCGTVAESFKLISLLITQPQIVATHSFTSVKSLRTRSFPCPPRVVSPLAMAHAAFLPSVVVPSRRATPQISRTRAVPVVRTVSRQASRRNRTTIPAAIYDRPRLMSSDRSTGLNVVHVPGFSKPGLRAYAPLLVVLGLVTATVRLLQKRAMKKLLATTYARKDLNSDIAEFYDARSEAWITCYGEHMHHGLYFGPAGKKDRPKKGIAAQIETMDELLRLGGLIDKNGSPTSAPQSILDIGCGVGGASRHLARTFPSANVTGVTLSPYQAERATQLNKEAELDGRVKNVVCDALNSRFPDASFDVVWSLESAEHMADKHRLIEECMRLLKPGGRLVMLAWCMRESTPPLRLEECAALRSVQVEYCLPRLAPPSEYCNNIRRQGLRGLVEQDWTDRAAPFWNEVVRRSFFNFLGWKMLRKVGWPLVRSALAMRHVISAIRQGCFKLAAFTAFKPTEAEAAAELERRASLRRGC